jgi:hypothetical protein
MAVAWSANELEQIGTAEELRISASRADGTLRREVPVWVVRVSGQVYVRTWYRRGAVPVTERACTRRTRACRTRSDGTRPAFASPMGQIRDVRNGNRQHM